MSRSFADELRAAAASIRASFDADHIIVELPVARAPQRKRVPLGGAVAVKGHTKRDGTKVAAHRRAKPGGRS